MPITIYEACKKRKRTPNIFSLSHFAATETAMDFGGSFRDNIRDFLKRCSEQEDYSVGSNPVWCTLLVSESNGVVFPLYTVEDTVKNLSSGQPPCDLCRFVGWGHHFVSKRNYHFIIPEDSKWNKPLKKESLKLQTHLLHGVIHCNGFGHLLCVRTESNSNYLHGEELMNLWGHLCASLLTRDISVHDLSKKGSMDLRLLYGVAYGRSWFGKWGYKLSRGSFGITKQDYNRALEIVGSIDLSKIISDSAIKSQGKSIEQIIQIYRNISESELTTISELLKFMLAFESKPLIQRKTALALATISSKYSTEPNQQPETPLPRHSSNTASLASVLAAMQTRWSARRLEHVVKVIFEILEDYGAKMLREELRNAIRGKADIGDTGLIDFVLKHINKVILGNQIIVRANEPQSKLLAFSLEDASEVAKSEREVELDSDIPTLLPGLNVCKDLLLLYKKVLLGYSEYDAVSMAVRIILDSKHFVKKSDTNDSSSSSSSSSSLRLMYQVRPSYDELVNELTRPLPPGEQVVVPENATVGEFKLMLQNALRDTYWLMDEFVVKDIEIDELKVWVRGHGMNLDTKLRYQGGDNDWTIDCKCRAKDDDGERMVACDVCHVWQHTRCNSIKDDHVPPPLFLCRICTNRINKTKTSK
ncbi:PHD finger protein At2g01810 [Euphorbia lathyris]|uniref:PHD finger protein At2g01810 n=1 Tax=Euphorbia lathyris TaxID=212925 RepID=UPI0033138591